MNAIKTWYRNLSNSSRAALATIFFTFITTIGLQVLGLLAQLQDYLNNGGDAPSLDAAGKLALSAVIAAAVGLVNWVVRYIQEKRNPASVPQYPQN